MITEISAGMSALKAAHDIIKGLDSIKTEAALGDVRVTLQAKILEAQQEILLAREEKAALLQSKRQAEEEIARLKDWGHERSRYALKRFHPGTVVYEYQPTESDMQPPHRLCAHCYTNAKKGFLQAEPEQIRAYTMYRCGECALVVPIGPAMDV